jgi:hypothetical protein
MENTDPHAQSEQGELPVRQGPEHLPTRQTQEFR